MHDEVRNIIAQSLGIDPQDVDETSTLGQDLGLSAGDIAEIVTAVNLKYETEIDPDEAAQAKTVEELFETIGKYVPEDLE
ncbi:MAG: hypothetical protein A3A58_02490 [Candidatus Blackburnbacteria bacterium RIFCSPLOWO2_01_FULL_41_27]|uniref:Carrier domain-containing protein n=2 Tax=Candidatus Blackburniibacteriota TaxID=1817898 RepID=A0A1G1V457_9BACT|nr:MAG: hypothetical protein A3F61_02190 [Candidatus Blackburnbacteria bacterium RIFCSPHIGHO2_12_FULL_41_13b]OGY14766.1 MAG: hypothetical protein A3A58_02490 [Candidatus Blackburnbacteria bacterium RIFCSPLOWO2_01_FULL_41_27]OGZ36767.1 MAG: hypothetical protein A3D38_00400 [Candidatus Portnoybacteria bacterium RIFCSPHIGHO2_02_FULL_40_23]